MIVLAKDHILQKFHVSNVFDGRPKNGSRNFIKVNIDRVFDALHFSEFFSSSLIYAARNN